MNYILQEYFENLEDYLVKSARLASVSSIHTDERAESFEDLFANILKTHLPARAAVATHRHILGADSKGKKINTEGEGPSSQIDVVVYNEWTAIPNLLEQGYILAESVYLALEVKARGKDLVGAINEAVEITPSAKVTKRLRPETAYFGNVRKEGTLSLHSVRYQIPTFGIVVMPWGKNKLKQKSIENCLDKVAEKLERKGKLLYCPDVIYIPKQFLAFKVVTKVEIDGCMYDVQVGRNEYPFLQERRPTKPITLQSERGKIEVVYKCLTHSEKSNLLYTFIFWLSQEILKFAYEIPDYHRYLLPKGDRRLNAREAANITKEGIWKMTKFNTNTDKWE